MFYIYHILGKKIGVTRNLNNRITVQQGYQPSEYEVLDSSDDIDYISAKEAELQLLYGYKIDLHSYKELMNKLKLNKMETNVTEQTITFACPVSKLKGQLMDNIGEIITSPYGNFKLTPTIVDWIMTNVRTSMYNPNRSYVYNKALSEYLKLLPTNVTVDNKLIATLPNQQIEFKEKTSKKPNVYKLIRAWAKERGIYDKGDSKTQYVKLMEEAGELAKALLTKNRNETIDAIGDIVVVLTNLAHLEGLKLEDCVVSAYTEIANRKGSMQNGTFVKNNVTQATPNSGYAYYTGLTNTAKGSTTNTFNSTL
jgi:NTP pyrophosphatase (non-canonical NTP hydrolase)